MTSVCMAAYNGERYIRQQLDSILSQLDADDELIISDDGSRDGTVGIITGYTDSRIVVLHHQKTAAFAKIKYSRGFYHASVNFENALRHAKGDYIFLSDQDDVWLPGKKEKMVAALQHTDCVLCNYEVIDGSGKRLNAQFYRKSPFATSIIRNLYTTPFLGCCMAFTKDSLNYLLPFPAKLIGHDLWIGCLCCRKKKMIFIPDVLHQYRIHSDNVSPATAKSRNSFLFKIQYRIVFLLQIIKRIATVK